MRHGPWTLLANVGLNFKYSLPNKVFEYIAAGLPILAADLPEVRKIVDGYKIGVCFNPIDPDSIAASINQLADDRHCSAMPPQHARRRQGLAGGPGMEQARGSLSRSRRLVVGEGLEVTRRGLGLRLGLGI